MSGLAGINSFGAPVSNDVLARMLESLSRRGGEEEREARVRNGGFCFSTLYTDKESRHCRQPFVSAGQEVVLWNGRLDNRAELFGLLDGVVKGDLQQLSDVEIVWAAYLKWGEAFPVHLIGDFAVSVWDRSTGSTILARDHSGARSLYYFVDREILAWASDLNTLLEAMGECPGIEDEYVAGYLMFSQDLRLTPYKGVFAVQPAHVVKVDSKGTVTEKRFWGIDPEMEIRYSSDREYEDAFLELFSEAVSCRLRVDGGVLAELSGGLDSSSVVCMGDKMIRDGVARASYLETVSAVSDGSPTSSERAYIALVEKHRRRESHFILEDELPFLSPVLYPGRYGLINPLMNAELKHDGIVNVAREVGARVVLSGIGGDELVHSTNDPAPELSDLLASFRWRELNRRLRVWGPLLREPYGQLLWRCGVLPCLPRRLRGVVGGPAGGYFPDWFTPSFVDRFGLRKRSIGTKDLFGFRNPGGRARSASYLSAVLAVAVGYRQEVCPFDVAYPYLDRRFVEFMLAVPYQQLVRPGDSRSLMRRCLVGILPEKIRLRRGKGNPGETVCRAFAREWRHLSGLFRDPRVVALGYAEKPALDQALTRARHGYPQGTATLLATVSLEIWLREFERRGARGLGASDEGVLLPQCAAVT
jgi:asparagine synthase (glutamine-hydrolysing)